MKKPKRYSFCQVKRRMLVTHGTLSIFGGPATTTHTTWETKQCGIPLFTKKEERTGECRSCASGWTDPHNYRVKK